MDNILVVAGAHKTGTSTICGILNLHPEILVLYEFLNLYPKAGKHDITYSDALGKEILESISEKKIAHSIIKAEKFLNAKKKYLYFGTKIAGTDKLKINGLRGAKFVFTIRDIRTQLMKDSINNMFKVRKNRTRFTRYVIGYMEFFLNMFMLNNSIIFSMEDVVLNIDSTITRLQNFLNVDLKKYTKCWHKDIGNYKDFKKRIVPDWKKHSSTFNNNKKLDIESKIKDNKNFNVILSIFDKYYFNLSKKYSAEEINKDLKILKDIRKDKRKHINYNSVFG